MNTKLKCLLLDDELPGLSYLKMLCEQFDYIEVVRAFNNPEKLLAESAKIDFDLCFLDIEMPGTNGLEVAKCLAGKAIIFTTAYKEYAHEAFNLNAIDYLTKPIQKERLEKALQKAADLLLSKEKTFAMFNSNMGKTVLYFDQIMYVCTNNIDKRDKVVWLKNEQKIVLKNISFEQIISILPSANFCRVNKAEIVCLSSVSYYSHNSITFITSGTDSRKTTLKLSDNFKASFLQKMQALS